MAADVDLLPLPAYDIDTVNHASVRLRGYTSDRTRSYVRANVEHHTTALNAEIEALRAEVERLRQLVNGGRGPLPAGAVAWLDMSPGEASLAFDKKSDSNRANKRRVMELFHRVSAGYYPLYLEPQADRAERLAEALRRCTKWGGLGKGWDSGVALDLIAWIEAGMVGELPPLPHYLGTGE